MYDCHLQGLNHKELDHLVTLFKSKVNPCSSVGHRGCQKTWCFQEKAEHLGMNVSTA